MTSVVTNVSDLTPAMREALAALGKKGSVILHRFMGNALVGKGLARREGEKHYSITVAGARALDAIERETASTVVVQSLGSYGWVMQSETELGGHAVTTWTRDGHMLVLSWAGAYEVSAAIYDGVSLPLEQLAETILIDDGAEPAPDLLLDMAARHVPQIADRRYAHQLSELLSFLAEFDRQSQGPSRSIVLAAGQLAAAILATPPTK